MSATSKEMKHLAVMMTEYLVNIMNEYMQK